MRGFLTPEQRVELLHELKVERHAKYSDRIKVILLLDKGWTHEKISEALFLDQGTIRNYRKRYVEGGILGLVTDTYSGKRCHLTDKEKDQLSNYLQSKICMDSKEIVAYIETQLPFPSATFLHHNFIGCLPVKTFHRSIVNLKLNLSNHFIADTF